MTPRALKTERAPTPAEAFSGEVKRQRRSKAERLRIVEETLVPSASVARVATAHQVDASQLHAWRRLHQQGFFREYGHSSASATLRPVRVARRAEVVSPAKSPAA